MNLKNVCKLTGLSKGAVRYYINEEVISPACTENYYGLKIYKFSQEDVDDLMRYSAQIPYSEDAEERGVLKSVLWWMMAAVRIAIVWLPLIIGLFLFLYNLTIFRYPVLDTRILLLVLLYQMPSIASLAISRIRFGWKKPVLILLLILCVLCFNLNLFISSFSVIESRTTDIYNYRKFDSSFSDGGNEMFENLFPESIPDTVADTEAEYYYNHMHLLDPTYDVYAQWTLSGDEYEKEINRVSELFEAFNYSAYGYGFTSLRQGDYDCTVLYKGDEPFGEVKDSYHYYLIFASDDESKTVRYIYSYGLEAEQPYYLQLDW